LTLEKTVPLYKKVSVGQYNMPDDSLVAEQYILADKLLSEAGFNWYEISSWAKNERRENQNSKAKKFKNAYKGRPNDFICKHNLGYWQGGQWLGIGAGAAGSIKNKRFLNPKSPAKYLKLFPEKNNQISQKDLTKFFVKNSLETLSAKQVRLEKIMLASRTKYGLKAQENGISEKALKKAFDLKLIIYKKNNYKKKNYKRRSFEKNIEENYIVPTLKGRLLHNYLVDILTDRISL
jgi:oxygen-independent coproporphyrinogen-3 oxidase